jgi:2-methylisocitrate lyase-like PEP mutase family enzyme
MPTVAEKRAAFRALHRSGCFVMPNPWDVGSARYLQHLGFPALASTSSGCAWTQGKPDNAVGLEDMLAHLTELAGACDVPVNADFEGGYADAPEGVAANVARATATGVAGLSIEDSTGKADAPLYDRALAVERVRAAREAIDASGGDVVLTGRAECFLVGKPDLGEVIARLTAYAAAGADCLYAPGLRKPEDIIAVVDAVAPKPVNLLLGVPLFSVSEVADMGVRRISVGGALARVAWGETIRAARALKEQGSFAGFAQAAPFAELDGFFRDDLARRS